MDQERVFLTILPGLEELALEEIKLKAQAMASQAKILEGGLELQGSLEEIHALQSILKIPTRFLWRVLEFKARDLPKVYQKTKRHPWRECFSEVPDQLHCTSERSRLIHTDKIGQTLKKAIADSLIAEAPKKRQAIPGQPQQLYIRVIDDVFTLSRDLTGVALHYRSERGEISSGHEASVRRTLASAMLMSQLHDIMKFPEVLLIDPMMGSGTLLEEANDFFTPTQRQFAGDLFIKRGPLPALNCATNFKLVGIDLHQPKTLHPAIEFHQQDCFHYQVQQTLRPLFVISNPPYGVRITKDFQVNDLISFYFTKLKAQGAVILTPRSWDIRESLSKTIKASSLKTRNSGLAVHLWKLTGNQSR
jgi:putative N6-adenine-specific DNA methylase